MAAERVIAAVQHRVPVVGVGHPGLEVVGDHLLRAAADIGEGADMGTEPVLVTLGPARFGVGQGIVEDASNDLGLTTPSLGPACHDEIYAARPSRVAVLIESG